jgi:hypothetical protein
MFTWDERKGTVYELSQQMVWIVPEIHQQETGVRG